MTVTFIKRECDQHPGCYTMSDKCERCIVEEFHARIATINEHFHQAVRGAFKEASS